MTARGREQLHHRKEWLRKKVIELAAIFAVEVGWYAVLDNHLHLVLRIRPDLARRWSDRQVIQRACRLFPYTFGEKGVENGEPTKKQLRRLIGDKQLLKTMRERLSSLSWFMKRLCESIAKEANREDGVSGHFFEGRFRSREILDEVGLLICGVYVDLNWVRAGKAQTPEQSEYTSAADRIRGRKARARRRGGEAASRHDGWLTPLSLQGDGQTGYPPGQRASDKGLLEMTLDEYLKIADWTGRQDRSDKRGAIPLGVAPILERLSIQEKAWLACQRNFGGLFKTAIGSPESLQRKARELGQRWLHGQRACRNVFSERPAAPRGSAAT